MKLTAILFNLVVAICYVVGSEAEAEVGTSNPKLKVLVHSNFGRSHIKPIFEVCKILRAHGHDIKYAANADNLRYVKEYDYDFVSLGEKDKFEEESRKLFNSFLSKKDRADFLPIMSSFFAKQVTLIYKNSFLPLHRVAEEYKPDLMLCDFFAPACRDVAEKLSIPFAIGFQTTDAFSILPSQTTTGSMDFQPITTDKLTFWERINDRFIQPIRAIYHFSPLVKNLNSLRKEYGVPTSFMPFGRFDTIYGIANTFIGLEPANGIPPNINLVGPILSDDYTLLADDLKTFFDSNQRILYIAFGSNVPLVKSDIHFLLNGAILALENKIIDGVAWGLGKTLTSNFPETVTLFNKTLKIADLIEGQHDKIRILKWAPQIDILKHKNTKVFISHGGLESTFEAITSGTPIVSVPVFGDQPRNAMKIENMGIGKYIDRITATPKHTFETIKYVLEDPNNTINSNVEKFNLISLQNSKRKYKAAQDLEDLVQLSKLCRKTEPFQIGQIPCEIKHLIPVSTEMSVVKALNLDIYFSIFSTLVFMGLALVFAFYVLIKFFIKKLSPVDSSQKVKKEQ